MLMTDFWGPGRAVPELLLLPGGIISSSPWASQGVPASKPSPFLTQDFWFFHGKKGFSMESAIPAEAPGLHSTSER